MPGTAPSGRTRDAARSREAILDAAEALFAGQGYDATSLHDIGQRAGVSRGTPGYFFRSKERLYQAVLARVFAAELDLVAQAQERAIATGGGPLAELTAAIESFLDFLAARPTFVQLIEREALTGGRSLRNTPAHAAAMEAALATTAGILARGPFRAVDPALFLLDLLALCWFPFAHADTFARGLGLDATDPSFVAARKRHVVDLLLRGARAG